MSKGLLDNSRIFKCKGPVAAGSSDITDATGVQVSTGEGVMFVFDFGAITSGAATSVKARQSTDNNVGDAWADIESSKITVADGDDDKLVVLDIRNPQEGYVQPFVSRATQNAVLNGITAIVYDVKNVPVTQSASHVAQSKTIVGKGAGTA